MQIINANIKRNKYKRKKNNKQVKLQFNTIERKTKKKQPTPAGRWKFTFVIRAINVHNKLHWHIRERDTRIVRDKDK